MKLAFINDDNELELRWMWLPVFIGMNHALLGELRAAWAKEFPNGVRQEEAVDKAHEFAVSWLANRLQIDGLAAYLSAITNVQEADDGR